MKYFSGEPVEIALSPSQWEIDQAILSARKLMSEKLDQWILDQLTIDQLKRCIEQFSKELRRRTEEAEGE